MSKLRACIDKFEGVISLSDKNKLLSFREDAIQDGRSEEEADTLAVIRFNDLLIKELNGLKLQLKLPTQPLSSAIMKRREKAEEINKKYDALEKLQEESFQFELKDSDLEYLLSDENEGRYDSATIIKAIKEANRILKLPTKELFKELQKIGVFNLGRGEKYDVRPNLGLSTEEYNNTMKQLASGKDTKTVEWLDNYLTDLKKSGELKMIRGVGGTSDKFNLPLYFQILGEKTNAERGLSEIEERQNLEKLEAQRQYEESLQKRKASPPTTDVQKVVERMQKVLPKFKISYDDKLNAAGKIKGNQITINPFYAGKDTPIHEAGHALIDFIGYKDKVIQKAIEQLKSTPLWKETKERYPELNDEMLGKEVLAEAIGREGAGIFDTEVEKGKFRQVLDYIFDWLKRKLGLEKNIAKSLAKQIISGIGTKKVDVKVEEQLSKPKKFKELDELTQSELQRKITKTFEGFRTDVLKRDLTDIRNMLIQAKEGIASEETSEEDKIIYQQVLDALKLQEKRDKSKWMAYKEDRAMVKELLGKKSIKDMTVEELVETYNLLTSGNLQSKATEEDLPELKKNLAYKLFTERKEELKKYKNFVEQQANVTDLKPRDVLMKTLSHMSESFPELQKFGTIFDNAYFDMQTDRNDLKTDLEKLGKEVIKEKNKQLGIKDKVGAFTFSNSAKYFDFVEHPDGRYYTLEEAKQKGFTEAQTKFLKFMLNLNKLRNEQLASAEVVDEVLKVDKSVGEAFQTEGIMQAFSSYLGNGFNIKNVVIDYDGKKMPYGEVEKDLMKQGEKGTVDKAIALAKILKYNFRARRQLKTGVDANQKPINTQEAAEYQLSPDGQLKSKFNKSRDKGRSYSKDFYHAAFEFIDDYTHVKHMNPIMPYINSIEELNQSGFEEHAAKPKVAEWIKEWKDLHLFKQKKVGQLGPEIDVALKTLRKLSSLTTMFFNLRANAWNVAIGTYNNIRSETAKEVGVGSKRLAKDWIQGGKAVDILNKYQVVSIDRDSNPKLFAGRILDQLGYMFNRLGETYIQGSMFLGQMTDEEFNSFEYKTDEYGVKKLVVKPGIDEKKLREKFISYKNRVSDIQGKYAEKDMRNFTNSEFGKAIGQYKIFIPDWTKERFGERYIDRNGVEHVGSYRAMFGQGLEDLRAEIKENGMASLMNSNSVEAKAFRSNLKGAMVLGVLFSLKAAADDDDEDAAVVDKALGQILFIFDPHQTKFTISNPVPAVGVLNNFLNVLDDAKQGKFEKAGKGAAKLVPMNKVIIETEKLLEEN